MAENLRNLGRFLALVVMTALVLRPVVVSTLNASLPEFGSFSAHFPSSSLTSQPTDDHAYTKAGAPSLFRALNKEKQDPSPLEPCASKPMVFQVLAGCLWPPIVQPSSSSLQTFQVLRI